MKEDEEQPYTAADGDKEGDKAAMDDRDRDAWQPYTAADKDDAVFYEIICYKGKNRISLHRVFHGIRF